MQGTAIGQALLERGFLESVSEQEFVDGYALYFPLKQSKKQWQHEQQLGECQEPLWVKQIPQQDSTTTTGNFQFTFTFFELIKILLPAFL